MKVKDFLGKTIKVGDTIVYPVRQGSDMWMSKAEVLGINKRNLSGYQHITLSINVMQSWDGRPISVKSRLYNYERCVVVPA